MRALARFATQPSFHRRHSQIAALHIQITSSFQRSYTKTITPNFLNLNQPASDSRPCRVLPAHTRGFAKRLTNRRRDVAVRKKKPIKEFTSDEVQILNGEPYEEPVLEAWVHSMNGDHLSIIPLNSEVFAQPIRKDILHRCVVYQSDKERGWSSAKTLTRGEISGTGKKPYRQKGTGRARRGTFRAPHHRGGGKAHGPVPRDFTTKLPKKVRKLGNKIALSARYQENEIVVIDELKLPEPKTAAVTEMLKTWGWEDTSVLFVVEQDKDRNFELGCRNITNVEHTTALRFHTKAALLKRKLVLSLRGLNELQAHLLKADEVKSAVVPFLKDERAESTSEESVRMSASA